MDPTMRTRFGAPLPAHPASLPVRGRGAHDRSADLLHRSPANAKRLFYDIPEMIRAILVGHRDEPRSREDFRRRVLVAVSDEPEVALSNALLCRVIRTDAEADAELTVALIGGITPAEARAVLPRLRMKLAVLTDLVRALEAM